MERQLVLLPGLVVLWCACGATTTAIEPEPTAPEPESAPDAAAPDGAEAAVEYEVPELDAEQLAARLVEQCERAVASGSPLLVEFSASWCPDCVRLYQMEQEEPLRGELAQWPAVFVNLDEPDRHRELARAFEVSAIAHWTVTRPTDCAQPPAEWPRGASRTLEPVTGAEVDETPASLAEWLRGQR